MTITLLLMAIQKFLQKELADDTQPVPPVLLGYLTTDTSINPVSPVIMLRPTEGEEILVTGKFKLNFNLELPPKMIQA